MFNIRILLNAAGFRTEVRLNIVAAAVSPSVSRHWNNMF